MSGKRVPAKRGRPPTVLIADPAEEREDGEYGALMAQSNYERELRGRYQRKPLSNLSTMTPAPFTPILNPTPNPALTSGAR